MATDNEMSNAGLILPSGSDYISKGDDAISTNARVLYERAEQLDRSVIRAGQDASRLEQQIARVLDPSPNLFDRFAVTDGMYLPAGSGTAAPHSAYVLSDPIRVFPGAVYTYSQMARVTYFGESDQHVGDDSLPAERLGTYRVPAGAAYVRLSILRTLAAKGQMNAGSTLLPYSEGGPGKIPAKFLALPPAPPVEMSSNLINADTMLTGVAVSRATGDLSPNSLWNTTDWISVSGGTDYAVGPSVGEYILAWYDADKAFISAIGAPTGSVHKSPPAAQYLRASVQSTDLDTAQISEGSTLPPYEPFWVTIAGVEIIGDQTSTGQQRARYLLDTAGLEDTYTAPTIAAQPDLDATTTNDVHGWYDALMAAHPDYVTARDLGLASDGTTQLREYRFSAEPVPTTPAGTATLSAPVPIVLLISGVHGFEKSAVWNLWRFAQALCEDWQSSSVLDAIRWNVEIVVVPVGNPHSYDQSQPGIVERTNANGVDVARNFEPLWQAGTPGTSTYGGTAPLTEPESIILDQLMQDLAPRAVAGASLHSFSSSAAVSEAVIWQAAPTLPMLDLGRQLISRMSRKWRREQSWITAPQTYYGYTDLGAPGGSEGRAMQAHGFMGSTFETSRNQLLDAGSGDRHTSEALTLAYEATVNYIAMLTSAGLGRS